MSQLPRIMLAALAIELARVRSYGTAFQALVQIFTWMVLHKSLEGLGVASQ